jgi:5-bromo-4-chloroindolyl phosphate hydrolysis protein
MTPKTLILAAITIVSMSFNKNAGLTDTERKYASNLLQETRENLLNKVRGLTPEQL